MLFKTFIYFTLLSTTTLSLTSCVSTQKYNHVSAERDSLKTEIHDLNRQFTNEMSKENRYEVSLNEALEKDYNQLQSKNDELKSMVMEVQEAMEIRQRALKDLYTNLNDQLQVFFPEEVYIEEDEGRLKLTFFDQIFFESGSDQIGKRGLDALRNFAAIIQNEERLEINVIGHTDNVPVQTEVYDNNWDLSVARAASVVTHLEKMGLNADRLVASGKSKFDPNATNLTPDGRKYNRRTEIVLIPDFQNPLLEYLLSGN